MGLSFLSEIGNMQFTFSASVNTYHLNCQQLARSGVDFVHWIFRILSQATIDTNLVSNTLEGSYSLIVQ